MLEHNKIYNMDCLEGLKQLDDESVDLVICDFPYNISNYGNSITMKGEDIVQGDFGEWDKWTNMNEYLDWVEKIIVEILKKCKNNASLLCFFDNRLAGFIAFSLENKGICKYKSPIIWKKNNPLPHIRHTGFRSTFEHAVWLIKDNPKKEETIKPKTFNFLTQKEMCNVMNYDIGQKYTTHTTEKPLELTKRMIKILSNENDLVLDCFMGSGTSAVASKQLNRNFIGFEISKEYCDMANDRLKQNTLFSYVEEHHL
jgi:site-specific DNA-methyltransferase (adenine-specific)